MTEPQTWVMIGVFSTVMLGMLSAFMLVNWRMFNSLRSELQTEMRTGFEIVNTKMDERFARVDAKIDHLDRDVSALIRRDFGEQL